MYLLAESDPRVVVLSLKLLARLLVIHGSSFAKRFIEKNGGFAILAQRLKAWWNVPAVWTICFCILFGKDVSKVDFERDFDLYNLTEALSLPPTAGVVYPEIFPVIATMLKTGLRAVVKEQEVPTSRTRGASQGDELKPEDPRPGRRRAMSLLAEMSKQGEPDSMELLSQLICSR